MIRRPYISKAEQRAAAFCCLVLLAALVAFFAVRTHWGGPGDGALTEGEKEEAQNLSRQIVKEKERKAARYSDAAEQARPVPFDPNHADSLTLIGVGLRHWQVSNMMKYRRKGGKWRTAEQFSRLYGLSAEEYERLRPYIRIAPADRADNYEYKSGEHALYDTQGRPRYEKADKMSEGERLSLNLSDTTALKRIPGIGSYYARKIVGYRERMGGFVSAAQMDEIEDMPPGLSRWFSADAGYEVRRIAINRATFKELVRHPYLSYEQTRVIVNHIRHYGKIRRWSDLSLYREFTEKDFQRLTPYISFE